MTDKNEVFQYLTSLPKRKETLFSDFKFTFEGLTELESNAFDAIVEHYGANSSTAKKSYRMLQEERLRNLSGVKKQQNYYDIQFILDCIVRNECLEIEDYRLIQSKTPCFMARYVLRTNDLCVKYFDDRRTDLEYEPNSNPSKFVKNENVSDNKQSSSSDGTEQFYTASDYSEFMESLESLDFFNFRRQTSKVDFNHMKADSFNSEDSCQIIEILPKRNFKLSNTDFT